MRFFAAALCASMLLISAWSAPAQERNVDEDFERYLDGFLGQARRDRIRAGREVHPPLVAGLCEHRLNILNHVHGVVERSQGRTLATYRQLLALERLYSCPPGGPDTPPPPLPPPPVQQEFQQALTRAMNLRASRNCDPARLARNRVRAIIREAERTGTIPAALLESWKSQLRAEDALACTNPIPIPQTASVPLCRSQLSVYPAAERGSPITCRCRAGSPGFLGSVYGSGPYTADSYICTAARHAGALTSQDGLVTVTAAPGMNEYEGSVRNGVTSRRYHAWPESMNVVAAPR